ncbi:hypothetical protein GGX14DRAFT_558254 [Mycena pura]|uniref:Uncharacterized protein n=1 Tax=Mycena pura TaxID=153505 RepID=A0AAD6VXH7_9AGAR|nr:hypothetical protein GGX14DRAFT_558254 [Mycena pura]
MAPLNETLNPNTPLAFLPPDLAREVQVGGYVLAGTLGAYIWDILCNLHNDYKLLLKYRVGFATVVYFVSRLWSLMYILSATLIETFPLGKACAPVSTFAGVCYTIAVPGTCLLFFLRARAIYNNHTILGFFFFIAWLSVLGTAALVPFIATAANIGPTDYCIDVNVKSYASAATITPLVHDTIIFVAISLRLFRNSYVTRGNFRAFVTGEYLPQFSKALLKDGQLYYLAAVTSNTLVTVMLYNTRVAFAYRTMFTMCNIMITNAMACHVFRNTKFGLDKMTSSDSTSGAPGHVHFTVQRITRADVDTETGVVHLPQSKGARPDMIAMQDMDKGYALQ